MLDEYMWLIQPIIGVVAFLLSAFVVFIIGLIGGLMYRDWLGHREGIHPAWGPRRVTLVLLAFACAFSFGNGYDTLLLASAIAFVVLAAPTLVNSAVVAYRWLAARRSLAQGRLLDPLLAWHAASRASNADKWPDTGKLTKYAWFLPSAEMLDLLAAERAIVEVGAGTGYLAWLLRQKGVNVVAYDSLPGPCIGGRHHFLKFSWTWVRKGDAAGAARRHADRTLLLCWPPAEGDMSSRALFEHHYHGGKRVIYIGSRNGEVGAATGDSSFHSMLEREYVLEKELPLPTWNSKYKDAARVYRRIEQQA